MRDCKLEQLAPVLSARPAVMERGKLQSVVRQMLPDGPESPEPAGHAFVGARLAASGASADFQGMQSNADAPRAPRPRRTLAQALGRLHSS